MRWRTAALLVAMLVLASPAFAQIQITTGVIQGTVTDATGAVLPGVTVEVKNVDTNAVESRITDANGRFVVLQLPPGKYTATFRIQGFATLVQEDLIVTVGQGITLLPQLKEAGGTSILVLPVERLVP